MWTSKGKVNEKMIFKKDECTLGEQMGAVIVCEKVWVQCVF